MVREIRVVVSSRTSRSRDGLEAFFERLGIVSVSASYVSFTTLGEMAASLTSFYCKNTGDCASERSLEISHYFTEIK